MNYFPPAISWSNTCLLKAFSDDLAFLQHGLSESAKLRALRAHVPTCQRALRAYVLTCQCVLRAYVLTRQLALRAHVPTCLACLRAHVPCVLTCQRALRA